MYPIYNRVYFLFCRLKMNYMMESLRNVYLFFNSAWMQTTCFFYFRILLIMYCTNCCWKKLSRLSLRIFVFISVQIFKISFIITTVRYGIRGLKNTGRSEKFSFLFLKFSYLCFYILLPHNVSTRRLVNLPS